MENADSLIPNHLERHFHSHAVHGWTCDVLLTGRRRDRDHAANALLDERDFFNGARQGLILTNIGAGPRFALRQRAVLGKRRELRVDQPDGCYRRKAQREPIEETALFGSFDLNMAMPHNHAPTPGAMAAITSRTIG